MGDGIAGLAIMAVVALTDCHPYLAKWRVCLMAAVIQAPLEMVEAVAALRLPPKTDRHLQALMDRNTNGALTPGEREQLEALVELSEMIGLVRATALYLLGRKPA